MRSKVSTTNTLAILVGILVTAVGLIAGFLPVASVELSFEDRYLGFFLKSGHEETVQPDSGTVLSRDQFLVLQPSRATMVRVAYGPFTAKQTVPYPSSLPLVSFNQSADLFSRWPATTDVTAYLVTKEVTRERPVLRVLFHFTQSGREAGSSLTHHNYQNLCVLLMATAADGQRRMAACSPSARETTCLAELVVPHRWWPATSSATGAKSGAGVKAQKTSTLSVEYAVAIDVRRAECTEPHLRDSAPAPAQLTTTQLWHVPVAPGPVHYSEVIENGSLQILIPRARFYPLSKVYVPVYVRRGSAPDHSVNVFVMRAKVKNGLRILEAETSVGNGWSITVDLNAKRTVATVTAFLQEPVDDDNTTRSSEEFEEVFSWLLEVDDIADTQRTARIMWSVRYVQEAGRPSRRSPNDDNIRLTTDLDVQKDDIQTVLLVSKTWELVNTAVLNGKQVSLPIKVFIVSQAGKVGDVTLQSLCSSSDESILKVSPSCTSVYLDGSEIRGSHNASVVVKYGTYVGHAQFTVWLPEMPLDIYVEDTRLSQIRDWKAPKEFARKLIPRTREKGKKFGDAKRATRLGGGGGGDTPQHVLCRLRYQQTPIDVFARFIAVDDNSGRESYLLNRKSAFRVTELVEDYLRIADPRIASLKGRIVQGQSVGRTEVQILSPITGRVIGATELRVGKDKERISGLKVSVVTGLQLSIKPNYDVTNGFVAETAITHQLTAQYQEGLLDISILFSDGMSTPLSQIAENEFVLALHALERTVVALAPAASSHRPRVIALGEGQGRVHVVLETAEGCGGRRGADAARPLATAVASVGVTMKRPGGERRAGLQNDANGHPVGGQKGGASGGGRLEGKFVATGGGVVADGVVVPGVRREPSVQARQNPLRAAVEMSTLEMGMYALLGIFCLAIAVFVASCAVYAVQFHRKQALDDPRDRGGDCDPAVANAHDWVWLGRATLERKAFYDGRRPRAGPVPPPSTSDASAVTVANGSRPNNLMLAAKRGGSSTASKGVLARHGQASSAERPVSASQVDAGPLSVANENASFDDERVTSSAGRQRPSSVPYRERRVQIVVNPLSTAAAMDSAHLQTFNGGDQGTLPPPVPPHGRPMPSQRASSCSTTSASAAGSSSSATAGVEEADAHPGGLPWVTPDATIDYDVLVEYFDNLKESNA